MGTCDMLLETLTLLQTKQCDFPYPISDQTLKSIRGFMVFKEAKVLRQWGVETNVWFINRVELKVIWSP